MKKLLLIPFLLFCMTAFGQQYTLTKLSTGGFSVLPPGQTVANIYPQNTYRFVIDVTNTKFSLIPFGISSGSNTDLYPISLQLPSNVKNGDTGLAFANLAAVQAYISTAVFH